MAETAVISKVFVRSTCVDDMEVHDHTLQIHAVNAITGDLLHDARFYQTHGYHDFVRALGSVKGTRLLLGQEEITDALSWRRLFNHIQEEPVIVGIYHDFEKARTETFLQDLAKASNEEQTVLLSKIGLELPPFWSSKSAVCSTLNITPRALQYVDENLRGDKDFIVACMTTSPRSFDFQALPPHLQNDKDFALQATTVCGLSYFYVAPAPIQRDREVQMKTLLAVRNSSHTSEQQERMVDIFTQIVPQTLDDEDLMRVAKMLAPTHGIGPWKDCSRSLACAWLELPWSLIDKGGKRLRPPAQTLEEVMRSRELQVASLHRPAAEVARLEPLFFDDDIPKSMTLQEMMEARTRH